jgi:putative Mg2+ transporter-C (MgtC) family protein
MPIHLGWEEISVRLLLTVIAGILVGIDRGTHGHPVGLRTTVLVCLAASISMIQTNLLLPIEGKSATSFVSLDLMRLPLGILTGMGFIGAGAILKKNDFVIGITTAATLWFITVVGLCFGGGHLGLGVISLAIGLIVLNTFKRLENLLPQDQRAALTVSGAGSGTSAQDVHAGLLEQGIHVGTPSLRHDCQTGNWTLHCEVHWRSRPKDATVPAFVRELSQRPGISLVDWTPVGKPSGTTE